MADEEKLTGVEKYQRELERDTELNIRNIREKSLGLSATQAKWVGYYVEEKRQLKRLLDLRQKYVANKLAAAQDTDAFAKLKKSSTPDDKLKKIDETKHDIEICIEFIHEAMGILSGMGYNIKNSIEIFKMENV